MSLRHIGSLKFYFSVGATPPSPLTTLTGYPVIFPEGQGGITPKLTVQSNYEPVAGVNTITDTAASQVEFDYMYTLKSFDYNILSFLLGASVPNTGTPPTSVVLGATLNKGYGLMQWYKNGDVSGTPIRTHSGFYCQVVPDGEITLDPAKFTELKLKINLLAISGSSAPFGTLT